MSPSKSFANNSLSGKIVSNEKYNFELDTERVLYIQSGDYMSLTFPVTRKYPNDLVENLFIHRFGDGFIAYLFQYNFNSDDLENLDHGLEIVDIESKIKFTELSEFDLDDIGLNAPSFERGGFTGHIVLHDGVCWRVDDVWADDKGQIWYDLILCPKCTCSGPSQSGGGSSSSGPSLNYAQYLAIVDLAGGAYISGGASSATGSGSGYNPFNPIAEPNQPDNPKNPTVQYPNPLIGIVSPKIPLITDNCKDLASKSQNGIFRSKLNELSVDANGVAEAGMVTYSAAPNFSSKSYGAIDSNGSSFVQLTYDQNRAAEVTGFLHCHLNNAVFKCLAVFSLSDFVAFGQLIENSTKALETFTMYVTSDKGTFAIKITDKQELIDFKDYIVSNPIQALKDFENNVKHNQSPEKQIKGLLNFLKGSTANNSIELYQSDSNYQNWQQLYIDSSNKVKTKKC